ncbi:MAG: choice-of-anchor L domain-containing protein [Flavobacterium sp.]|nr:choice-of-anchor L domain-containing protein [Flavobacterium sp.]
MKKIFIFLLLTVCFSGFSQGVVIDGSTYTPDQLVNQILINSPCVSGTNVQATTGTTFGSTNGIGYFTNSNPNFPFAKGVVLTTGNVLGVPSPNNTVLSDGSATWPGDTALETILATQGVNVVSKNATVLEFDFIPSTASFDFSFIFASEEYGQGQCSFSDAFAFLLTPVSPTPGPTQNIAVINGNTPISVETIRDIANNPNCPSANAAFFGAYNGPGFGPAINFNGQTVELNAHADVVIGQTYHIKLVIADGGNNTEYDSAIFLEANSFNIGQDILPADIQLCSNDPLPTITTQPIPVPTTYVWTEVIGNTLTPLVPAQTGSSLNLANLTTPPGEGVHTYNLNYVRQGCEAVDNQIVVTIYPPVNALATVPPIYVCNSGAPSYSVDLTKNTTIILNNNTPTNTSDDLPATTSIAYFDTAANANANGSTGNLGNTYTLLSTDSGKIIYARIQSAGSPCYAVRPFALNIVASPLIAATPANITLCARNLTDPQPLANFPLTPVKTAVLGSQDPSYNIVSFYSSAALAAAGVPGTAFTTSAPLNLTTITRVLHIRVANISNPSCYVLTSIQLTVVPLPQVDILPDVVVCGCYTLPPLTYSGSGYYTAANGVGPLAVGAQICTTQNIYIYNNNGTCSGQDTFKVTKSDLPAIAPASGTFCTQYALPSLPYGTYYEFPGGPTAVGNAGGPFTGPVTTNKTLYVYFEDTSVTPSCVQEQSFTITIIPFVPLQQSDYPNQFGCTSYTLPVIAGVTYYTGPNKGLPIITGSISSPVTQKVVYAYKETGTTPLNCSSEVSFTVFIGAAQIVTPADVESCTAYTLPPLTVGQYFNGPGATGGSPTVINSGEQDVYISVPGQPCVNDVHFHVKISIPVLPTFPNIGPLCDIYYLPNPNHTGHYYTQPGGLGTELNQGDPIIGQGIHTLYFYDVLPSDSTCFVEASFTVEIFNSPPIDAKPVEVIQCNSCYTLDDLVNGEYYMLAGGPTTPGNTLLAPGTQICTPGTTPIYIYSGATSPNTCFQEYSIDIVIVSTTVNDIADVYACNSYTLPTIVGNGDYYELPGGPDIFGGNTLVPELTVLTPVNNSTVYTKTFYVYAQDNNRVACSDEDAFTVTIYPTPVISPIVPNPVIACDSYTLPAYNTFTTTPANAVNHYYTLPGGSAVAGNIERFPGYVVNSDTTIYVVAQVGDANITCFDEEPLAIDINATPVLVPAEMQNKTACDSYVLPALTVGNYYNGPNGTGGLLANLTITGAGPHTIYAYAETATTPNCTVSGTFTVTITDSPVISPITPIVACDTYTLPAYSDPMFTSTGAPITHFYTLPGGPTIPGGNPEKLPSTAITALGTTTLYAYAETGTTPNCFDEEPFTITISATPVFLATEIDTENHCDTYTLPALSTGNYYNGPNGTGGLLANLTITALGATNVYVYSESPLNANCNVSATFVVNITATPVIAAADIATVNACNDYTLPALSTTATSVDYYTGPNGSGTLIAAGTNYTTNQAIYVHAVNGTAPNTCVSDALLTINIYNVDEAVDATVCGSYILPALVVPGAGYYTSPNGAGPIAAGSTYSNTPGIYTLYVYGTNPAGTCTDESTFTVTINDNPTATMPSLTQTTVCDSDGVNDNTTLIDYDALTATILGTQSPATYAVTYYPTFPQAINQTGAYVTDNGTNLDYADSQIFAVVTNIATPLCFTPIQIDFTVVPKPESDPLSGVICVDGPTGQITPETIVSGFSSSIYNFTWTNSDGIVVSTAPNFTPVEAGIYTLIVSAYVNGITGCDSDPILVTVTQSLIPRAEDISFETTGWFTNFQTLTVIYNGDTSNLLYSLDGQEPQTGNVFTGLDSGPHEITVIDINGCGDAMLPIPIQMVNSPAFFTPNGDGINDTWKIPVVSDLPGVRLFIYDRYGKLLKQLQVSQDWDGKFNGSELPADDYWFTVNYVDPLTGLPKEYKSHFSLIR